MLRTSFTATAVASVAVALSAMLLLLPAAAEGVGDEMKAACEMWSKLENKTLPLQNEGHANCTTNEECTGFNCKGIYQVGRKAGIRIISDVIPYSINGRIEGCSVTWLTSTRNRLSSQ